MSQTETEVSPDNVFLHCPSLSLSLSLFKLRTFSLTDIPYIDQNSYSNSNNGGSVDSQDSLWKVTQVPSEQMSQQMHNAYHHHGNYEQYAPPEESYEDRTNYVTDPYGQVPKPKRRLDLIGK